VKDKDGKRRSTHGRLSPLTEKRLVTLAGHEVIVHRTHLFSVTRAGLQATWHLNGKELKAEGNSEQIELKWATPGRHKLVATHGDRRVTRIIDVIACPAPACGAAARILNRWTLKLTGGPVEHVKPAPSAATDSLPWSSRSPPHPPTAEPGVGFLGRHGTANYA
jgi:hypothetical protein